jgi:hypothetical protein
MYIPRLVQYYEKNVHHQLAKHLKPEGTLEGNSSVH